jgi:DNA polymerase-4
MEAVHPSLLQRKIIHVDMDAFYAAVEIRNNPTLAGKPVVIGGSPESRAVVCTASYEARKYGIRSAMACSHAKRLCPHAIFLPPNFEAYSAVSQSIREIFSRHTNVIEPLSLDEAYLDVTHNTSGLYASQIAKSIQAAIRNELSLSCSVGVGPNKLIAKIASDFKKPGGITVVVPAQVRSFMASLGVRKLFGVGPATEKRLKALGIEKCSDAWNVSTSLLENELGSFAEWIWEASQGIDTREVEANWERKSMGREETFEKDTSDISALETSLQELSQSVANHLHEENLDGRTVVLKVKYANFQQITRSKSLNVSTRNPHILFECAKELLHTKTEAGKRKVRLLGVSVSSLSSP